MASNYVKICEENRQRYGTEGAQKSGDLAAGLYDDRTHFIFELLQNAEDALRRRGDWSGSRKVVFNLSRTELTLSHFGKPFDEADVRSVCDIAESTKDDSSIGRFGLGFKSVYTVTDLPEIHSGEEDFAIQNYVFPVSANLSSRKPGETQIILPLKQDDQNAVDDIASGLRSLGSGALLFLRHIDEINWSIEGGASGFYSRNAPEILGPNVSHTTVIGKEDDRAEVDQDWLVFHREVLSDDKKKVGRVEIAFSLEAEKDSPPRWSLQPLAKSPLVVFFPTVVESHLGFLVQGPYRTTPSRDNIPLSDSWNKKLVEGTSLLLVEAMHWMRENSMLDISAISCLPLVRKKFPKDSRFEPMFDAVVKAFQDETLLPALDGTYVAAHQAKLARTKEVRELFSPEQITMLLGSEVTAWLSGDITQDKAQEILDYLTGELDIELITPAKLVPNLTKLFLEAQSDEWVLRLYEFLKGQEATLRKHLDKIHLVRLEDGSHVIPYENGEAKAFLPSDITTGFPTVRRAVCNTEESLAFLIALKITVPDPVDDVIRNILPKYKQNGVSLEVYATDIERICSAFNTDSTAQKAKLRDALRDTRFVRVVNSGDGKSYIAKPSVVYIATERLKQLFSGVVGVYIIDDSYDCLRGENIRELLESCGALRYPRPFEVDLLTQDEKLELRRQTGYESTSGANDRITDWNIHGLDDLIELLPNLTPDQRAERARLLWDSLGDLEERRGRGVFDGSYTWSHYGERKTPPFPAAFLRKLNKVAWVPDNNGGLLPPGIVVFDSLGWKLNPFLLTKIAFKPPIIDQLAREAGIDPAALDLLRKYGITSADELASRLGILNPPDEVTTQPDVLRESQELSGNNVYDDAKDLYGDDLPDIPPSVFESDGGSSVGSGLGHFGQMGTGASGGGGKQWAGIGSHGKRTPGQSGSRPFISYIGVHPNEDESDPDGLDQAIRMQIEESAIQLIVKLEPVLLRTLKGNHGFDLYAIDKDGKSVRWVEVKSMTGSLKDRPVGLSYTQFDYAREKGDAYWLYVVEHATDPVLARVLRIQNPVGYASTFTFDQGWCDIAKTELPPL